MKILLLGDSIRLGYAPFVKEMIKNTDEVFYHADNGQFMQFTYRHLEFWKADLNLDDTLDLVHWNNGIWDALHLCNGPIKESDTAKTKNSLIRGSYLYEKESITPPEIYELYTRRVYQRIRTLFPKAKIIFATTTSVPDEYASPGGYLSNTEIRNNNDIAEKVLFPLGVSINDLYAFSDTTEMRQLHQDGVHFSDEGNRLLAGQIVSLFQRYRL